MADGDIDTGVLSTRYRDGFERCARTLLESAAVEAAEYLEVTEEAKELLRVKFTDD